MQAQGGGPREELIDYLPPKKMQPESSTKYLLRNMQGKKKGIGVGVVGAEGAKVPRMYPVKAVRSR